MEQNEDLSPAIEDLLAAAPNEASLRRQVTNLLLGGSRDVRLGWLTLEQRDVLQKIETALEAYGNYFYPPEHRYRGGHGSALRSQAGRVTRVLGA